MCINGRMYVYCSECNIISNECNESTSCLMQPIGRHGDEVMYFWSVYFKGVLGFLKCDDICTCVFDSVYVDLQYDEISPIFIAGYV